MIRATSLQDVPAPVQPKSQALLSACDPDIFLLISWKGVDQLEGKPCPSCVLRPLLRALLFEASDG